MEVHSWTQLIDAIFLRKKSFLTAFFLVFLGTYSLLAWLDFLPEVVEKQVVVEDGKQVEVLSDTEGVDLQQNESLPTDIEGAAEVEAAVLPLTITIEALEKTLTVLNPTSREIADLDKALLSGVVRHPDSATLDQVGTVFILGHSSYLPVVQNKNFQALNGIQNLKWGDSIKITAAEGNYLYRVDKVYRAKATDVTVPIAGTSKRLFLATCNSFGSTDDRYIVEAELVEVSLF